MSLSSLGALISVLFFKIAAAILESRAGVNKEMMNVGPVFITEALPIINMYKAKSIRKCRYSIIIQRGMNKRKK